MSSLKLCVFVALRQLWDRRLLNAIAISGVALGVITLITMNGLMQGFQDKFMIEMLRISPHVILFSKELGQKETVLQQYEGRLDLVAQIWHEQASSRFTRIKRPSDLIREFEALPGIQAVCDSLVGQAILSYGTKDLGVDLRGVRPRTQDRCTPVSGYVQDGAWRDLAATPDSVALGSGVAKDLQVKLGDQVRLAVPGGRAISLKVVAIFDVGIPAVDKSRIYVDLLTAQTVLGRPNVIGQLEVRLDDPFTSEAWAARLERMTGHDAQSWEEANLNFLDLFRIQDLIIALVIGGILTVGGFGILAIQLMIVLGKTRDISILRAVGLRSRDILFIFVLQGAVISLLGAALGDLVGWRLVEFLADLDLPMEGIVKSRKFLIAKNPMFYVYGAVFALLVGIAASILPAWRASRVEPVAVLRGEIT
ncbi:MAG: ABC transporter permease [Deltaproteobacteria bacterium]|nr:ABC transporter permease [Deltaproteobacteria bacterium]